MFLVAFCQRTTKLFCVKRLVFAITSCDLFFFFSLFLSLCLSNHLIMFCHSKENFMKNKSTFMLRDSTVPTLLSDLSGIFPES